MAVTGLLARSHESSNSSFRKRARASMLKGSSTTASMGVELIYTCARASMPNEITVSSGSSSLLLVRLYLDCRMSKLMSDCLLDDGFLLSV